MSHIIPISIDGMKVIQLSQLGEDQAIHLRNFLPERSILKLFFQGQELNDCISFETYRYWLRNHHGIQKNIESLNDFNSF